MENTRFCAALLILLMFTGIFSLSPAISSLTADVVVRSTGKILSGAYARSGSGEDIQAAVDWVASNGGIGNVYIPEGTFNFVNIGESWMTVNIPVGVNLFGAPTERDVNGQVVEWKTVLVMPYEAPNGAQWFSVQGSGAPNEAFRFSDIKLVGWRFFDTNSTTEYGGLDIMHILNFRVDHCHFQDMCGTAIFAGNEMINYNRRVISGVIDHCRIVNSYGDPGFPNYDTRTLDYGIGLRRWACDIWDYNLSKVIGRYNNYTIFIEDNYFSKWRHCVSSNDGIHYVFRHNIVEGDYGIGSIDAHGSYADDSHPYGVGTRCIEVYDNIFQNPDTTWEDRNWAINLRGGSGIIFNNTLKGYYALMDLNNDWGNYAPYCPQCLINQTYIWNNNLGGGILIHYNADSIQNVNYFLRAPNLGQDGFTYTPYPYPHPLTLQGSES